MSTEQLERTYLAFDHNERLETEALYVKRDRAPSQRIRTALKYDKTKHWIFCGSLGSGKSTELAYLGHILQEDNYFVIGLDLYQSVDDVLTIQPSEVLMLIGAAAVRMVEERFNGTVPPELVDALRRAFMGVLMESPRRPDPTGIFEGVALLAWGAGTGNIDTAGAGVAAIAGSMGRLIKGKQRTTLGGLTRPSLRAGDADVVALTQAVNSILEHVELVYDQCPIVLVDGLDKLDSSETIRPLFCSNILRGINAASVYSAPITMMLQTEWQVAAAYFDTERLTNLVVAQPSQGVGVELELVARSRKLMREVVELRIFSLGFRLEDVFDHDVLDMIITESGGVLRTLVSLVRKATFEAIDSQSPTVQKIHVETAISDLMHEFQITMNGERRTELRAIRDTGEPSGNGTAFELLLGNYVLPYRNGHSWWAPAPLVSRCL